MNDRELKMGNRKPGFFSLGRDLNFTANAAIRLLEAHLAPYHLTPVYWIILGALGRKETMTVSEVAQFSNVKPPAASRLLARMERDGWVSQVTDKNDRRIKHFVRTDKGKEAEHLFSLIGTMNGQLTKGMSQIEIDQLTVLLDRVRQNALEGLADIKSKVE